MQVGVVGLNHKLASLRLREAVARVCEETFPPYAQRLDGTSVVLISTCNRTELYFSSSDLTSSHSDILQVIREKLPTEFEHRLYSYFGRDCFQHLARVTAGLDSAIVAETEIQGQVKNAYEATSAARSLPEPLHYLFQKSLRLGKRVRTELLKDKGGAALEGAIVKTGQHFFEDYQNTRVLFIGASEINRKIFSYFHGKGIHNLCVCNRSVQNAREMAAEFDAEWLPWQSLSEWATFDWIIVATRYPGCLISHEDLPSDEDPHRRLILDLSVPRNVDLRLAKTPNTALLNIDQVNRVVKGKQRKLMRSVAEAEDLIDRCITRYLDSHKAREEYRLKLVVG